MVVDIGFVGKVNGMTVVVTDNCLRCRFTECVTACPVACFHGDDQMVYIDPDGCIDCGSCIPLCPVKAIYDVVNLPADKARWIQINADRAPRLPIVEEQVNCYPGAEERRAALGF
jgi:ferredoxin